MSRHGIRLTRALETLEENEERDFSQFNEALVITALATVKELAPELYDEWIEKIARHVTIGSGQVAEKSGLRAAVDELIAADEAVSTGINLENVGEDVPAAPVEVENLPRPLGGVTEEAFFGGPRGLVEPYRLGDQFDLASAGNLRIQAEQRKMERAGLLKKGDYQPGFWDIPTSDAMALAMGYGNQQRVTFDKVLERLALLPKDVELRDPAPLSPDPASIAQEVKATFRQRLGREPSASELRELGSALGGFEEESLAQQVQQVELVKAGGVVPASDFTTVDFEGTPIGVRSPLSAPTPVFVDPIARFLELFDKRFGPEEARNRQVIDVANQRRSVMSSLTTMQALIEGG